MAALIACDDYILLTNGTEAGFVLFSSPGEFRRLPIPNLQAVSRGDTSQASLPRKKRAAGDEGGGGGGGEGQEKSGGNGAGDEQHKTVREGDEGEGIAAKATPLGQCEGDTGSKNNSPGDSQTNYVRALAISHSGSHVALCDDRKYLHVFHIDSGGHCSRISSRCTARRCTDVCFSPDDSLVLVADKSGDAYSFPTLSQGQNAQPLEGKGYRGGQGHIDPDGKEERKQNIHGEEQRETTEDEKKVDANVHDQESGKGDGDKKQEAADVEEEEEEEGSHGGSSDGTLVLGHLSMLLGVMLVDNGRLVVTCDRDEKIRISSFPHAYNIQAYCLGHTEFVIDLAYDATTKVLISASGDCTVRAWSLDGKQICFRNVLEDLPQGSIWGTTPTSVDETEQRKEQQPSTDFRPSIRKMVYCAQYSLLFVAMEKSPHINVYKLQTQQPTACIPMSFRHVTLVKTGAASPGSKASEGANTSTEGSEPPIPGTAVGEEAAESVAGLCVRGSTLWVLRRSLDRLWVTAHICCLGEDNTFAISQASANSKESQILKTLSEQEDYLTASSDAEDLLPYLWKSNFQEDFKLQCNLKRTQPQADGEGRKGRGRKKAKRGEKGR